MTTTRSLPVMVASRRQKLSTSTVSHLSEADKRAYILADNKLAEKAGWDKEILAIELQFLTDTGIELAVTGFEPAEVDLIIEGVNGNEDDKAENTTPAYHTGPAVTELGDMWMLGNH